MSNTDTNGMHVMEEKILHALEVFPFLSASLIHMSIGTSTPTAIWRPVLAALVESGRVIETSYTTRNSTDRQQTYVIYHLPHNDYLAYVAKRTSTDSL